MRKAAAFALAIAGVGSAVYLLPAPQQPEVPVTPRSAGAPTVSQPARPVAASPAPATSQASAPAAPASVPRVFSPGQPLLQNPQVPAPASMANSGFDPNARKLSSSRPADDDARNELVKDLQRELKRVGCYDGEVNGTWTPAVRKAMASFTDRVNATLPLDEPDYILLTLVQGHAAQACGQSCPTGQTLGEAGKCLPRAVVAQAAKRTVEKAAVARVDNAVAGAAETTTRPQPRPASPPRVSSSWSTVVTAPRAAEPSQSAPVRPQQPLPGRMAIGAPVAAVAPAPDERTRSEVARRKAELAAAAASQRDAESEAARKARLAEAEVRKEREIQALKQKAAADKALQVAAIAPAAAPAPAAPAGEPEQAPAARKAVAKKQPLPAKAETPPAQTNTVPPTPAPARRQAAPRPVPPPYAVGRTATAPRPYYAASPTYAPQPGRWMRTIFNDVTRMR